MLNKGAGEARTPQLGCEGLSFPSRLPQGLVWVSLNTGRCRDTSGIFSPQIFLLKAPLWWWVGAACWCLCRSAVGCPPWQKVLELWGEGAWLGLGPWRQGLVCGCPQRWPRFLGTLISARQAWGFCISLLILCCSKIQLESLGGDVERRLVGAGWCGAASAHPGPLL